MAKTSAVNLTSAGAWQYGNAAADAFAKEDVQNLGANADLHDHSANKGLAVSRLATSVTLTGTTTLTGGGLTLTTAPLTIGTTVSATGSIRLPNNVFIGFRNSTNAGDNTITMDNSDRLALTGITIATTANAGGGAAVPGTVAGFIPIQYNGTSLKLATFSP